MLSNCKAAPDYELLLPFIAPRVMRLNGVAGTRHEDPESAHPGHSRTHEQMAQNAPYRTSTISPVAGRSVEDQTKTEAGVVTRLSASSPS